MAALVLAAGASAVPPGAGICEDPLETVLFERYRILAPVICWPQPPLRILRISAQIYNHVGQYRQLADALRESWRPSGSFGRA
ncbi:MAG: hypothetical protein KAY24_09535 [Candidatus Eisenbacteria sp.]|nr:hypothetical protein [Candidatus Eisenbacteria bacterium]